MTRKTIKIPAELYEDLKSLGGYGDSMGDIIKRLYDSYIIHSKELDGVVKETMQAIKRKRVV